MSDATPAVYFTELRLRNVRCFGDEEQVLEVGLPSGDHAGWTVLLGDNGNGKTTVLECLSLIYGVVRDAPAYHASIRLQREATADGKAKPASIGKGVVAAFDGHANLLRLAASKDFAYAKAKLMASAGDQRTPVDEAGLIERGGIHIPRVPPEVASVPTAFTISADRSAGVDQRLGKDMFPRPSRPFDAAEWLQDLDYAAAKADRGKSQIVARLKAARSVVVKLLPSVTDLRFTTPDPRGGVPRVEFDTPDGWVPLARTAYGYQTLFVWVLDLVARLFEHYPDSENPLSEPAVVLVDEIELHLHPSWQRRVLKFLDERFPRVQWVVTTHSPLVAQAAPEVGAKLAVLRRKGPGEHEGPVEIDNTPDAVRGWRVDQVLSSDLFGETSPRDEATQAVLDERRDLLRKPKLSARDAAKLNDLEGRLASIPLGESRQEVRDRTLLRETLEVLKKRAGGTAAG